MSSGNADAWRIATFALVAIVLAGALLLRRDRRPNAVVLVVAAAVVVTVLAIAQARFGSSAMNMASMQSVGGVAPVPVTLGTVRESRGTMTIEAPADVSPYFTQDIVTRAPGLLTDLSAYTGDRLHAGQVVARLDEPELQSDAQAAAASAQAAQSDILMAHHEQMIAQADLAAKAAQKRYWDDEIARERALLDEGAVSRREYDDERTQAVAARSAYDSAQAKLGSAEVGIVSARARAASESATAQSRGIMAGYTSVIVPDDSVVMKRLVDPGVYVQAGTPILHVAVLDRLRVDAQVAQHDLPYIDVGTPVDVILGGGKMLHGRISSVSPVADPQTHTALAQAIVANERGGLVPGGFAHAILHARTRSGRCGFALPSAAILGGTAPGVWVDQNESAHRVAVSVLSDDGTTADVTGNLRPGMRVVVSGAANLEEGQAITESPR